MMPLLCRSQKACALSAAQHLTQTLLCQSTAPQSRCVPQLTRLFDAEHTGTLGVLHDGVPTPETLANLSQETEVIDTTWTFLFTLQIERLRELLPSRVPPKLKGKKRKAVATQEPPASKLALSAA